MGTWYQCCMHKYLVRLLITKTKLIRLIGFMASLLTGNFSPCLFLPVICSFFLFSFSHFLFHFLSFASTFSLYRLSKICAKVLNTSFSLCLSLMCPLSAAPVSFPLSSLSLQPADQRMRAVFLRCKYLFSIPSPFQTFHLFMNIFFFLLPSLSIIAPLFLWPPFLLCFHPFLFLISMLLCSSTDNKSPAVKSESPV